MSDAIYYFVMPDTQHPVGGMNVLIQMAEETAALGHKVKLLYAAPGYRYAFWPNELEVCHDPALKPALWHKLHGTRHPIKIMKRAGLLDFLEKDPSPKAQPGPNDIIVIPDYAYVDVSRVYPESKLVVAAQDVYAFYRSVGKDPGLTQLTSAYGVFTTSEASTAAVRTVYDGALGRLILPVGAPGLTFHEEKAAKIAYMPRKRPVEAQATAAVLSQAPETAHYEIVKIDKVSPEALVETLCEARFFLSFSKEEGFGLPPAEAMCAGCIVIGYTGVGAAEYFTPETGLVVPDSDIVGMIETTRHAVAEYDRDPTRLDAMRKAAAELVSDRYTRDAFRQSVIAFWAKLNGS